METSQNKSLITGILYKVQPRYTSTGKLVVSLTVEVRNGKGKSFISVVAWQGLGERAVAMGLGSKVFVSGKLMSGSWQDAQGNRRYKTEIIADTVEEIPSLQSRPNTEEIAKRPISDEDIGF